MKRGITGAVSKALKAVQKENINTEDRAVYSTETANAVCSSLEAVFLHGLRATSAKKIASFVGLGHQDKTAEQSLNFWQFVSKFTHGEVVSQLKHLGQITTEIGLCRAWVRLALNDCLMESYVDAMTSDKKTLEYFYHRTCYLRDSEHPGILKAYLQGLMAFEFKLSYNSSVLNEWSYTPLILAGIIESDDSPLPVIKPAPAKTFTKESSVQDNTSVEISRVRARSKGSLDGKDKKSKHTGKEHKNPMANPRLGQPGENTYYVTSSEFTSQDVEEIKRFARDSARAQSFGSSSSQVSAPDPPHLNISPADYVEKDYRGRIYSNKSNSTNKSNEFEDREHKPANQSKEIAGYDDTGPFKIDMIEEESKHYDSTEGPKAEQKMLLNKYKPAEKKFIENLPPIKKVSEDFLKELYTDDSTDFVDSKEKDAIQQATESSETMHTSCDKDSYNEYKNYSGVKRLESINIEAKEDAILSEVLLEESESPKKTDKNEVFDVKAYSVVGLHKEETSSQVGKPDIENYDIIEAFNENVDLNGKGDMKVTTNLKELEQEIAQIDKELKEQERNVTSQNVTTHADKELSALTESDLNQLSEELKTIPGHIEGKSNVDVPDSAVKKEKKETSPKRKLDKRRQSKEHLKPDFSPPRAEPLKPELSPAKAEKIDTFKYDLDRLKTHRMSLPTSDLPIKRAALQASHRQSVPNILESNPDISQQISSSTDLPERYKAIYDGKPLEDEVNGDDRDGDDHDIIKEDDVPMISKEPRQSVGNSLMLSGRGWSSSFDSELNDTIEPLSSPRTAHSLPVTNRPKAESFGSLLQNYTPSSSLSAPSIDDVLHNFPRTETIIAAPCETSPIRSPVREDSAEEFEIVMDTDNPDSNMVARLTQLSEIANEKGLDAQNFQCNTCKRPLGLIFGKPRVCSYDGGYYCFECHENDEYYIPARIVHNWDFRKHKVSKKSLEFLQEVEEQPHIDIEEANPRLYEHVSEIQEIKKLRTELIYLKTYLFTCKQSTAEDFRRLIWPRDYLYENVELYSLADLLQIPTGGLAASLRKVIKFATKHVYSCRLCCQKGFICELCNNAKVIYAFEMDATYRCPQCHSVYHKECKTDNRPCPKCQRRSLREASIDLETSSHDLASHYLHTR